MIKSLVTASVVDSETPVTVGATVSTEMPRVPDALVLPAKSVAMALTVVLPLVGSSLVLKLVVQTPCALAWT
ncbi:hypothetical protein, partial [Limnohabitans sp.]|uniref:hypothetical protein n=1 Tax=Limnohabitans sp. TaxID=1907725 RepID=UPI0037BE2612